MERYSNNEQIMLWDRVTYSGAKATVVYVAGNGAENPKYPKADWETEVPKGIMIECENGALLQLDECNEEEDLDFLSRGTPPPNLK